jgi:hypothetical protein
MGRVRIDAACVGLALCVVALGLAVSGCGGGSSSSTPSTGATTTGGKAIHEPIQGRGIKGEDPSAEAASDAHISPADCLALAKISEERLGKELSRHPTPKPPLSRCRLEGKGTSINIYLDSGFAANQRYHNRIDETVQFNSTDPDKLPHPVAHVGEKSAYNSAASWIPNLRSLLAVRGNRWLTVTISVKGKSDEELRDEAAVLARAGFKLTAMG